MGQVTSHILIHPFTYQSQAIRFSEWVTLFTLSLAPLVAHIAAGAPIPSVLSVQHAHRPRWHDSICMYNPTSILWRYAAIADRRIRARDWCAADMAASNALFWTGRPRRARAGLVGDEAAAEAGGLVAGMSKRGGEASGMSWEHNTTAPTTTTTTTTTTTAQRPPSTATGTVRIGGWDGSEAMIAASLPYCTALPPHAHAELASWETAKTLIITLQGLQVLYILAGGLGSVEGTNTGLLDAVNVAFFPLTLVGLFRLCAAGWLASSGFAYTARDEAWMGVVSRAAAEHDNGLYTYSGVAGLVRDSGAGNSNGGFAATSSRHTAQHHRYVELEPELAQQQQQKQSAPARFHPVSYMPSILFRSTYLLFMFIAWALALLRGTPATLNASGVWEGSVTTLLLGVFYLLLMTVSCGLCSFYFFVAAGGEGIRTTIIPCAGSPWYKAYTIVVFAWMAAMFVVACCETTRMPCGRYTSLARNAWDGRTDCVLG